MPTMTMTRRDGLGAYRVKRSMGGREVDVPCDALGRYRKRADMTDVTVRADGDDDTAPIGFRGHAAVFDSPTWIGSRQWGFMEQVARGAFTKTLDEADVRLLLNHDPNLLLARNLAGNLQLSEDDTGLAVEADMVPTTVARDLALLMAPGGGERATIDQMSFAFEIIKESWELVEDDEGRSHDLYTITEARLWDVSIVTYPAYDDTDAALRAVAFDALTADMNDLDYSEMLRSVAAGTDLPTRSKSSTRAAEIGTPVAETSEPPPALDGQVTQLRERTLRARTHEKAGMLK